MAKNNGSTNVNFPKCKNCLRNLCNAGMVNHNSEYICFTEVVPRLGCLFECGCTKFEEYKPGDIVNGMA